MASRNEITGDALVSRRTNDNYRDNYDRVEKGVALSGSEVRFDTYKCDSCNIKVSTSNGCCPCCGKDLVQK